MDVDKFFNPETVKQASKKQEKRIAKKNGAKVTPASGALGLKGDVRNFKQKIVYEAKMTKKKQLSLKKEWLLKLKKEAGSDIPVLVICIDGEEWYCVRHSEFAFITEALDKTGGR